MRCSGPSASASSPSPTGVGRRGRSRRPVTLGRRLVGSVRAGSAARDRAERLGSRPVRRPPCIPTVLVVLALVVAGCGDTGAGTAAQAPPPTVRAQDFPRPSGVETLDDLEGDLPKGPILQPRSPCSRRARTASPSRSTTRARTELSGADVALYTARPGRQQPSAGRSPHVPSCSAVKGAFASRSTTRRPGLREVRVRRRGPVQAHRCWSRSIALVRLDDRLMRTRSPRRCRVGGRRAPRPPGSASARCRSTPTPSRRPGETCGAIDTRLPPAPELHRVNLRDALGKKPVVLVVRHPAAVPEPGLRARRGRRAAGQGSRRATGVAFIHQEVYKGQHPWEKGVRPQPEAWRLATEPWTFVIDRRGTLRARFEGPMSPRELAARGR